MFLFLTFTIYTCTQCSILNQEPGTNHTEIVGLGSCSKMNVTVPETIPKISKFHYRVASPNMVNVEYSWNSTVIKSAPLALALNFAVQSRVESATELS